MRFTKELYMISSSPGLQEACTNHDFSNASFSTQAKQYQEKCIWDLRFTEDVCVCSLSSGLQEASTNQYLSNPCFFTQSQILTGPPSSRTQRSNTSAETPCRYSSLTTFCTSRWSKILPSRRTCETCSLTGSCQSRCKIQGANIILHTNLEPWMKTAVFFTGWIRPQIFKFRFSRLDPAWEKIWFFEMLLGDGSNNCCAEQRRWALDCTTQQQ